MMQNLVGAISGPLFKIVDKVIKDPDLKAQLQSELTSQMLDSRSEIAQASASVVRAEVGGESWLQRNWRPMLMLWFAFLIAGYWFGLTPVNMPQEVVGDMFTLVQIGIGGYIVGRSGEKITKHLNLKS